MTVQGWETMSPASAATASRRVEGGEDDALRGPTFSVSGSTFSPGQHAVNGGNLDATFSVSTTPTDGDSDGLNDCGEKALGTDPTKPDTDGDGLNDGTEAHTTHTDPNKADSDGDGLATAPKSTPPTPIRTRTTATATASTTAPKSTSPTAIRTRATATATASATARSSTRYRSEQGGHRPRRAQ